MGFKADRYSSVMELCGLDRFCTIWIKREKNNKKIDPATLEQIGADDKVAFFQKNTLQPRITALSKLVEMDFVNSSKLSQSYWANFLVIFYLF